MDRNIAIDWLAHLAKNWPNTVLKIENETHFLDALAICDKK